MLAPNQLRRFYRGGARIEQLQGGSGSDDGGPEDWVGSTTTGLGADSEGLSRLPDGRLLRGALEADPVGFLGPEHVCRWGANPALLVKLLDAGERLPVHFHPGRAFARETLGLDFGKTEAWIIVDADADAVVHLGLRTAVQSATVLRWVQEQDVAAMLDAMYQLQVHAGQVLFVPAGTVHAIGSGILLVELQEPTDLSVLLESERFGVHDGSEHLGLGWPQVLSALDLSPARPDELIVAGVQHRAPAGPDRNSSDGAAEIRSGWVLELLPRAAAPYFRAQRVSVGGEPVDLEPSFAILIVLDGFGMLSSRHGDRLQLARGDRVLVPHAAGSTTLEGDATVIRCLPPAPDAGAGRW